MKIRVIRNFDCYIAGQEFEDWPAGMSEILIQRGFIEDAGPAPSVETAEAAESSERAATDRRPPRRKQ